MGLFCINKISENMQETKGGYYPFSVNKLPNL